MDRGTSSSDESLLLPPPVGGGGGGFASGMAASPSPSRASLEELCACICASGTSSSLSELDIFCCLRAAAARAVVGFGLVSWLGPDECVSVGALIDVVTDPSWCYCAC